MGMDPTAHLWFGIVLGEGEHPLAPRTEDGEIDYEDWQAREEAGEDFGDFGVWLAQRVGVEDPRDFDRPDYDEWRETPEAEAAISVFLAEKKRIEGEAAVELVNLTSADGDAWWGIAVKGYVHMADWNVAKAIRSLEWPDPERTLAAREFCAKVGLPEFKIKDATWKLTTSYG